MVLIFDWMHPKLNDYCYLVLNIKEVFLLFIAAENITFYVDDSLQKFPWYPPELAFEPRPVGMLWWQEPGTLCFESEHLTMEGLVIEITSQNILYIIMCTVRPADCPEREY